MDLLLLRVFQQQARDQCMFALAGASVMDQAGPSMTRDDGQRDRFWIGCQMVVGGAGNLSKLLWGDGRNRAKVATARQPLRDSLGVDDSSPLYELGMRNHFEHFDERIDKWWADSSTHNYFDRSVFSPHMIQGMDQAEFFRVYDPSAQVLRFWGDSYPLREVVAECQRILPTATAEAAKPHWEPRNRTRGGSQ